MVTWLFNNISTIIVCGVLIAVVAAIVAYMVRNKRQGKSSCGCGCKSCAMRGSCHSGRLD
ncbi:MAG: FeoB-associated Cys-rich membrane protein [Clostridiales bacterium]|nr:FeoB-associated Cys-rich membrane protein [Clostridiales bacterium]